MQTPRHTPPHQTLLSRQQGHEVHKNHQGHHAIATPLKEHSETSHCAGITQPLSSNHSLNRRMTLSSSCPESFRGFHYLQGNPGPRLLAGLPHQVAFSWLLPGIGPQVPGMPWVVSLSSSGPLSSRSRQSSSFRGPSNLICDDCGVPKHPSPPAYLSHTSVCSASWLVLFCFSSFE